MVVSGCPSQSFCDLSKVTGGSLAKSLPLSHVFGEKSTITFSSKCALNGIRKISGTGMVLSRHSMISFGVSGTRFANKNAHSTLEKNSNSALSFREGPDICFPPAVSKGVCQTGKCWQNPGGCDALRKMLITSLRVGSFSQLRRRAWGENNCRNMLAESRNTSFPVKSAHKSRVLNRAPSDPN